MTTKHICGGPVFGRLAPVGSCARCDELRKGAPVVSWGTAERRRLQCERLEAIRNHDCKRSGCGPFCTAFDW